MSLQHTHRRRKVCIWSYKLNRTACGTPQHGYSLRQNQRTQTGRVLLKSLNTLLTLSHMRTQACIHISIHACIHVHMMFCWRHYMNSQSHLPCFSQTLDHIVPPRSYVMPPPVAVLARNIPITRWDLLPQKLRPSLRPCPGCVDLEWSRAGPLRNIGVVPRGATPSRHIQGRCGLTIKAFEEQGLISCSEHFRPTLPPRLESP